MVILVLVAGLYRYDGRGWKGCVVVMKSMDFQLIIQCCPGLLLYPVHHA